MLDGRQFITWRRSMPQALLFVLVINFPGSHGKLYLLSPQSKRNETVTCSCVSIKERRKRRGAWLQIEPQMEQTLSIWESLIGADLSWGMVKSGRASGELDEWQWLAGLVDKLRPVS